MNKILVGLDGSRAFLYHHRRRGLLRQSPAEGGYCSRKHFRRVIHDSQSKTNYGDIKEVK